MASTMGPEYPEYNGENFRVARNAARSMYGHAREHEFGVYVKFGVVSKGISTEEARAAGQALIDLADQIEYDQAHRVSLPMLSEIPNGTVFRFRSHGERFWTPGPTYIKLTYDAIWSDRSHEIQKIGSDSSRTVQIVEQAD